MKSEELRHLWDAQSDKYWDRSAALGGFPFPEEFLPHPGDTVLDAGCGSGNFMAMYRGITSKVFGLDFSPLMTAMAARRGATAQGDVQRLPFKCDAFDYVWSHVVINHVPDTRLALAELARVTRPRGRLVVVVPNRLSFLAPARMLWIKLGQYTLGPCRHYTLSELRREGNSHGLSVARACTVGKQPSAPTFLKNVPSAIGYVLDQVVRLIYPLWGGDLAVLFQKTGSAD